MKIDYLRVLFRSAVPADAPPPDALEYLNPLEPRELPFAIHDPHDENTAMSRFDNIAAVLRHRGRTTAKLPAYWVLDNRGKEIASITWDKLASRAEKVAQVIRDKSSLYRGDRVALIYRDTEIIEFASLVEATAERLRLDREREDEDIEVVAISAPDESTLRRTHSRYFVCG